MSELTIIVNTLNYFRIPWAVKKRLFGREILSLRFNKDRLPLRAVLPMPKEERYMPPRTGNIHVALALFLRLLTSPHGRRYISGVVERKDWYRKAFLQKRT
jgi:hypothetical protein